MKLIKANKMVKAINKEASSSDSSSCSDDNVEKAVTIMKGLNTKNSVDLGLLKCSTGGETRKKFKERQRDIQYREFKEPVSGTGGK